METLASSSKLHKEKNEGRLKVIEMEEKIFEVKGTIYKLTEIEEGSIYELKKQRKNGVFYKISRYNSRSMEEALEYAKEYKIRK